MIICLRVTIFFRHIWLLLTSHVCLYLCLCALLPLLVFERGCNLVALNIETITDSLIQQLFFLYPCILRIWEILILGDKISERHSPVHVTVQPGHWEDGEWQSYQWITESRDEYVLWSAQKLGPRGALLTRKPKEWKFKKSWKEECLGHDNMLWPLAEYKQGSLRSRNRPGSASIRNWAADHIGLTKSLCFIF